MPDAVKRSPYRPMPVDFAEKFIAFGWDGIEAEYHAHKRSIRRWLQAAGEKDIKARRREFLEHQYAKQGKRVPGRRPTF